MGRGRPIDQSQWPRDRPRRTLFELIDQVHRDHGLKSLSDIAAAMNLTARSRVSTLLRGTLPVDEGQAKDLIRALGGSDEDVERARMLYRMIQSSPVDVRPPRGKLAGRHHGDGDPAKPTVPPGAMLVREARPRQLGVHAAIRVEGASGELPIYVPRDIDAELRAALTAGQEHGCMVVLIGGSSVGKTRTLYEAVAATLPDWWLIHSDPRDENALQAIAEALPRRTVVWLDELQRYLDTGNALTAGMARTLLRAGTVLLATMWNDEYADRIAMPRPGDSDPGANARDLLKLAHVVGVAPAFTPAEQARAEELSADDARIKDALGTPDSGLTQALAAGPALVRRWEQAPTPYSWAVITAAADARRLGNTSFLSRKFLAAAVPGYLTPAQRATAPDDWLDQALAYASTPLLGAASPVQPVDDGTMGGIAGYTVADFLLQHARITRRTVCPPASLWESLIEHTDPDHLPVIARQATERMRYCYAELANWRLADAGDQYAARPLLEMLAEQGRTTEAVRLWRDHNDSWSLNMNHYRGIGLLVRALTRQGRADDAIAILRTRAQAGDWAAEHELVKLFAQEDRFDEVRSHADGRRTTASMNASVYLADHLAAQGNVDELRARADAGDQPALCSLPEALARQGRYDELLDHARAGYSLITEKVTGLLIERGRSDLATEVLRAVAARGYESDARLLAGMLADQGDVDELSVRAAQGDRYAAEQLTELLVSQDRIDELRELADAGHFRAGERLVGLLAERGQADELRARSSTGDRFAADQLAGLLAAEGNVEELKAKLAESSPFSSVHAAFRLVQLLMEQDRADEAIDVMRAGYWQTAGRIAELLAARGLIEKAIEVMEIRVARSAGFLVTRELIDFLVKHEQNGRLSELADRGYALYDPESADKLAGEEAPDILQSAADEALAGLMAEKRQVGQLRARAEAGSWSARERLADLLPADELVDALRGPLHEMLGNSLSARKVADALIRHGRVEEATEALRPLDAPRRVEGPVETPGFDMHAELARLFAKHGRLSELRAEVDAGTKDASSLYVRTLANLGRITEAEAQDMRTYGLRADGSVNNGGGRARAAAMLTAPAGR